MEATPVVQELNTPDIQELSYENLWKAIIRPPRDVYTASELLDGEFNYRGRTYVRKDYDVKTNQGKKLKCSLIEPQDLYRTDDIMPIVIYLHGNSSSRLEGMRMASILLKRNINLFVFDFAGSGMSQGEYISLGWYERDDLDCVVKFVSKLPGVGKIGLWGRSMGAATALMYENKSGLVSCAVYDSPYAEFRLLAKQLCSNYKSVPFWIVDLGLIFIKKTIYKKIKLDIDKLNPIEYASHNSLPGYFIHAMDDELIPLEHTLKIYEAYLGEKVLSVCEGGHNSKRRTHILDKIGWFFVKHLTDNEPKHMYLKTEESEQMSEFIEP